MKDPKGYAKQYRRKQAEKISAYFKQWASKNRQPFRRWKWRELAHACELATKLTENILLRQALTHAAQVFDEVGKSPNLPSAGPQAIS